MESLGSMLKEIQERAYQASQADKSAGSASERKYNCNKCKDEEGFISRSDDGYEYWSWCDCRDKKHVQRLFTASRITDEFRKKSFENFDCTGRPAVIKDARDAAAEYLQDFSEIQKERKNSIALLGVPGTGKTHLLMAIANELMQQGVGVHYFPWVEGFSDLRNDFENLDQRIHRLQNVSVLYIDDLFKGRKNPTEFQAEQLFAIVNHRYLNNLPIMISSEWDFDAICNFDMGIGSRLYEMCKDYAVVLKGGLELN